MLRSDGANFEIRSIEMMQNRCLYVFVCVFYMFFCCFFDLKIVSDVIALKKMNGDFLPSRLSAKMRVFCFVMKLQNAKIQKNACIFIDFW